MNRSAKKAGVLIVEDDMLLSMVEERLVNKLGYSVVGKAQSGAEAIEKVSKDNPDVILMDISLKGDMDGVETMKEIRKQSEVPVIFLSGRSDKEQKDLTGDILYADFLTKPISSGDLEGPLRKATESFEYIETNNEQEKQQRQLNKSA